MRRWMRYRTHSIPCVMTKNQIMTTAKETLPYEQNPEVRPAFTLMKLNDAISHFHIARCRAGFFPTRSTAACRWKARWLTRSCSTASSCPAATAGSTGTVRFTIDIRIVYTREDLAREMQVSYRKAISCFKELAQKHLLWEQRQGRGLPNRIFLAEVQLDEKAAYAYDCAPFCPAPRTCRNSSS